MTRIFLVIPHGVGWWIERGRKGIRAMLYLLTQLYDTD